MEADRDAYGHVMWAYYQGEEVYEIIERDDGFITASSMPQAYLAPYEGWSPHEKRAIRYAKGHILDIGCGAGRHALYLQHEGMQVTGIDASPLAVRLSKRRGLIDVRCLSIDELDRLSPETFDTILLLGNNFGLFGSAERAKLLLEKMRDITPKRARIITESSDPYIKARPCDREYHQYNRNRGCLPGQMRVRIRFEKIIGDWFDYLYVSRDEMKQILEGSGWRINRFLDSKGISFIAIIDKERRSDF